MIKTSVYSKLKLHENALNVHCVLPQSVATGPGTRFVIWLQGCLKNCLGCCNPDTHELRLHTIMTFNELCSQIQMQKNMIEGITISGGEPFLQASALNIFLSLFRQRFNDLSVIVFSGYNRQQIEANSIANSVLKMIDVLIDGEFNLHEDANSFPASHNQKIHFLTQLYRQSDFKDVPLTEIIILENGDYMVSGKPLIKTISQKECDNGVSII